MSPTVIRVDMAMSALSSAIDGAGHYHVRPRPVCLWPSCVRSANNGHNRSSSGVPVSVDLANITHARSSKSRYSRCNGCARAAKTQHCGSAVASPKSAVFERIRISGADIFWGRGRIILCASRPGQSISASRIAYSGYHALSGARLADSEPAACAAGLPHRADPSAGRERNVLPCTVDVAYGSSSAVVHRPK